MGLSDDVRQHAAAAVAAARSVSVDPDAMASIEPATAPTPTLDPVRHYLEGNEEQVAAYMLALDTVNFGSGWFPTLDKRQHDGAEISGYATVAWNLADRFRADGPWTNAELCALRADEIATVLGQRADHELMGLFAQALRQLGSFLGERGALDLVAEARGSAERLATALASGMSMYADRGFYKRAQIVPRDLALAGVATFSDLDRLTIFADNLVPHVLRVDGVLVYDPRLARHIDDGRLLRPGPQEHEIRAAAVHACATLAPRLGVSEAELDALLWNRGQDARYKAIPRHRCRTVFY